MTKNVTRREFLLTTLAVAGAIGATALPSMSAFASTTIVPLSDEEIKDLTFMREEEKVARDVYLTLYGTWRHPVFSTIAESEQQHMDTVKKKLDKYGLPDPAQTAVGAFTNPELQQLYIDLVAIGSKSLIDALKVGCTIEEKDIVDIQSCIDDATHTDIDLSYQNLMEGSYGHLRGFVDALTALGATYTPQFISKELYDSILGV